MSHVVLPPGIWLWSAPNSQNVGFSTVYAIDSASEKMAWIGPVWTPNRGAKNIQKVGFRTGAITKTGGADLKVSCQDVIAGGGGGGASPFKPDEVVDQTFTISNASLTANAFQEGTLDAVRAVNHGDELAVVLESPSWATGDSIVLQFPNISGTRPNIVDEWNYCGAVNKLSGVWSSNNGALPNVLLTFDDGTFGTIGGMQFISSSSSVSPTSASTPDEYCFEFTPAIDYWIDGIAASPRLTTNLTSDCTLKLLEGNTLLESKAFDAGKVRSNSVGGPITHFFAERKLSAGTKYRIAVEATNSSSSIIIYYHNVPAAGVFDLWPFGQDGCLSSRTNGATTGGDGDGWTKVSTRRPAGFGIQLSRMYDGIGGGSGGASNFGFYG